MIVNLARQINTLRRKNIRNSFLDFGTEINLHQAYQAAALGVELSNENIAAWKLGGTTASTRELFNAEEVFWGPLLNSEVFFVDTEGLLPKLPILNTEIEIALRLSQAWDGEISVGLQNPFNAFDAWSLAAEFPYSCFDDLPTAGMPALIADRCAAGALFLSQIKHGLPPEKSISVGLVLDNKDRVSGNSVDLLMSPVNAALEFCDLAKKAGFKLRSGQWISTGGLTRIVSIEEGCNMIELIMNDQKVLTLKARKGG